MVLKKQTDITRCISLKNPRRRVKGIFFGFGLSLFVANPLFATDTTVAAGNTLDNFTTSTSSTTDNVYIYGTTNNLTVEYYDKAYVYDGGISNKTNLVDSYSRLYVKEGGTANQTKLSNYSAYMYVENGGTANNTSVNYGKMYVDGGLAETTTVGVYNGTEGYLYVKNGGVVNNTKVDNGTLYVENGGTANTVTITSYYDHSYLNVSNGGTAKNVTLVDSYSHLTTTAGAIVDGLTIKTNDSNINLSTDATITNATQNGVAVGIVDKVATGFTLNNDSTLNVEVEGHAKDIKIGGGTLNIKENASASNITSTGGKINNQKGTIDNLSLTSDSDFSFTTDATVINATQQGKTVQIKDGTATGFTIYEGSSFGINEGHKAYDIAVKNEGSFTLTSGYVDGLTLDSGSHYNISTDSTIINATQNGKDVSIKDNVVSGFTVWDSDTLNVKDNAVLNNITIDGSNSRYYNERPYVNLTAQNAVANNTVVNKYGGLTVGNSAIANNTYVAKDGYIYANNGGGIINELTMERGAFYLFDTNATVTDMTQNGREMQIVDGVASNFRIGNSSTLYVKTGDEAEDTIIDGGTLDVERGSNAVDTVFVSGNFYLDGKADDTILFGGNLTLESNSAKTENTIVSGGTLYVREGLAFNTIVNNGARIETYYYDDYTPIINGLTLHEGSSYSFGTNATITNATQYGKEVSIKDGVATGFTIDGNSTLNIRSYGKAVDTIVNSGGVLDLDNYSNTSAEGVVVNEGGKVYASNTSYNLSIDNLTLNAGAKYEFNTNATITNSTQEGKEISIIDNVATGFAVNNGSSFSVYKGTAKDFTVNNGGNLTTNYISSSDNAENKNIMTNIVVNEGGKITTRYAYDVVEGLTLNEGALFSLNTQSQITNATQDGKEVSIVDGVAKGFTINNGSYLSISENDSAEDITINNGSVSINSTNGSLLNSTMNSGSMTLYGTSSLKDFTLNGGTIEFDDTNTKIVDGFELNGGKMIVDGTVNFNNFVMNGGEWRYYYNETVSWNNVTYNSGSNGWGIKDGMQKWTISNVTLNGAGMSVSVAPKSISGITVNDGGSFRNMTTLTTDNVVINSGGFLNSGIESNSALTVDGLTINEGGKFYLDTNDSLTNASIYGEEITLKNGAADGFVINDGSRLTVFSGDKATNTVVNSGGQFDADDGALTVDGLTLNEGAEFALSTKATVANATQESKDVSIVDNIAEGFVINDGSKFSVYEGHTAKDMVINNGGTLTANAGTLDGVTINDGAKYSISTDVTTNNTTLYGNEVSIVNKVASDFVVNDGSTLTVKADGTANNTVLNEGSTLDLYGKIENTTINQGAVVNIKNKDVTLNNTTLNGATITMSYVSTDVSGLTVNDGGVFSYTGYCNESSCIQPIFSNVEVNRGGMFKSDTSYNYGRLTVDGLALNEGSKYVFDSYDTVINGSQEGKEVSIVDGVMSGFTLNNESSIYIQNSEHSATDIVVNEGGYINGGSGTIDNLTLNEGAKYSFGTNATITNSTQEGKEISIVDNVATGFTIDGNSSLNISTSGKAVDTTINSGGVLDLDNYSNTSAEGVVVNEGGKIYANSTSYNPVIDNLTLNEGAKYSFGTNATITNSTQEGKEVSIVDNVATGFAVNSESTLYVGNGHGANDIVVYGGTLSTTSNSTLNDIELNNTTLSLYNNNSINNLVINNGAKVEQRGSSSNNVAMNNVIVNSGGNLGYNSYYNGNYNINGLTLNEGSSYGFDTSDTVVNGNQEGKEISIVDNVATGFTVNEGSSLNIYAGGTGNDITYNIGATISGTLNDSVVNSGTLVLNSGAVANDVEFNAGSGMNIKSGAEANTIKATEAGVTIAGTANNVELNNSTTTVSGTANNVAMTNGSLSLTGEINGISVTDGVLDIATTGEAYDVVFNKGDITNKGIINGLTGNFSSMEHTFANQGFVDKLDADFENNENEGVGGAIYNSGKLNLINSSFINNTVISTDGEAAGGAIYNTGNMKITANGSISEFSGNKIVYTDENGEQKEKATAVYLGNGGKLTFEVNNGGQVIFNDGITSTTTRSYSEEDVLERAQVLNNSLSSFEKDGDNYVAYSGTNYRSASDNAVKMDKIPTMLMPEELYGGDFKAFIDAAVEAGEIPSYAEENGSYIVVQQEGNERITMKITENKDLGGAIAEYKMEMFMPSEEYGGNIKALLDEQVSQDPEKYSYYEKDGVYYLSTIEDRTENGSIVSYVSIVVEDKDAGGVWIQPEAQATQFMVKEDMGLSEIPSEAEFEEMMKAEGFIYVKNDDHYLVYMGDDFAVKYYLKPEGYLVGGMFLEQNEAEALFAAAEEQGKIVAVDDKGNVTVGEKAAELVKGETGYFLIQNGGSTFISMQDDTTSLAVSGDGTGKVEFNEALENIGTFTVEDAVVTVSADGFNRATVNKGGIVNIASGLQVVDTSINDGGVVNVTNKTKALSTMVNNGGLLNVAGGITQKTFLNVGGIMDVKSGGKAFETFVKGGIFNVDTDSSVENTFVEKGEANISGSSVVIDLTNGKVNVYGSASDNTINGGDFEIKAGGKVINTVVNRGGNIIATVKNALIDMLTLNEGAEFHFSTDAVVSNATQGEQTVSINNNVASNFAVNDNSVLDIINKGTANNTVINDGGLMIVAANATANDTVVNDGGKLEAESKAKIHNMLANGGAIIDIENGAVLTGNIVIDKDAYTSDSTFDFVALFDKMATEAKSLTLTGGVNEAFNDKVINEDKSQDKSLILAGGNYAVASKEKTDVTMIKGWDTVDVITKEPATPTVVKVESDIEMSGSNKMINIGKDSILDLAGHSPLVATINASVNNDGNMNFSHENDGADDVITITGDYKAYKNAMMTIDVDPVAAVSDRLIIEGDVEGRTKVVINPLSDDLSSGKILFIEAMNDNLDTGSYFDVYRVVGDAHKWNSLYENNKWYLATEDVITDASGGYGDVDNDEELVLGGNTNTGNGGNTGGNGNNIINITQPKPQVVSEAIAYMSLPRIGLEQTKDLMRVVSNKVTASKVKCGNCGMSDYEYDGQAVNGVWIDLGHKKSEIDAPVAVEAKINAVDLGFDIQKDLHNRLGIFASYRQGEYELSGDGEDYYSKEGSDIDIDSWILGLYHRYDYGRLWTMSSIYGCIQKVDMNTDDGVSTDTDGTQFGGSIEAGLVFEPQKRLTIEPSIRLGYNFIKYDDMSDSYGKTAEFDNVQNIEAEAGVKVEKTWFMGKNNIAKLYVKPSIIQNFGKGDINITSLDTVEGLENETLIRGEVGGSFNFGNGWSGFGSLGYTYGSDYNATDFNIGINYNW